MQVLDLKLTLPFQNRWSRWHTQHRWLKSSIFSKHTHPFDSRFWWIAEEVGLPLTHVFSDSLDGSWDCKYVSVLPSYLTGSVESILYHFLLPMWLQKQYTPDRLSANRILSNLHTPSILRRALKLVTYQYLDSNQAIITNTVFGFLGHSNGMINLDFIGIK